MNSGISPPSTFFRVQGLSTPIQVLSVLRIGAGLSAFVAPAFLTSKLYGFTTRQTSGAGATANTTTAKPGAPEETLSAIRLAGSRDIVLGLALRDSTSIVVERALELGFISSVIDALAIAYSFFIECALDMKVLKGSFEEGATEYDEVDRPVAYSEVLKTWAKWVDRNIDPNSTTVFFMGMSPNHITPEAWGNQGGIKCAMETQPIANRSATLDVGTDWRLYAGAQDVLKTFRRVPVHFVDITALSELRKDAHTSVHTLRQGKLLTPEQQANPKTYADCIHWCLPGLPDTWNEFLYARIVSSPSTQQ